MKADFKNMLHGADYNYEQWLKFPEVLEKDFELMKKTGSNVMTIGVFSWSMLEPEEGKFSFEWMDSLFDRLEENGISAILATPSGSKPAWLSEKYPEVCRVNKYGIREAHGSRHNHCRTSLVYREKCIAINELLAERYKNRKALILWHVSNEYNSEACHCELCYDAFRLWLEKRYKTLDALNDAWWTAFWSHRFTDWNQIKPVDESMQSLMLDWQRFLSDQTLDFFLAESEPLRRITPDTPVTTNFMVPDVGLDYWKFAQETDVISWDSYPRWHYGKEEWKHGVSISFYHDLHRSYKNRPFLLMESTPSVTNWQGISIPKRPGMHFLASMHAIAHGSNSVQYFQWRQSRGGDEKFHSAVVSHAGHEKTRVFQEVAAVGRTLEKMNSITESINTSEVAVIYDYENGWALDFAKLPRTIDKNYQERCIAHYQPFWQMGITADIIDSVSTEFSKYKLLIAPMLYMIKPGAAQRISDFVEKGGTFVATYLSGIVNETDLCFTGGFPGPLRKVLGIWAEETDIVNDDIIQKVKSLNKNILNPDSEYSVRHFADIIHTESAEKLAEYSRDFIKGFPALTVNNFGKGRAYYICSRNDDRFYYDFYSRIAENLGLSRNFHADLPVGVTAQKRTDGKHNYIFIMNFNAQDTEIRLSGGKYTDLLNGDVYEDRIILNGYGLKVLEL